MNTNKVKKLCRPQQIIVSNFALEVSPLYEKLKITKHQIIISSKFYGNSNLKSRIAIIECVKNLSQVTKNLC